MEKGVTKGLAIGLIAGAAIGAGLGLLYAPQSGKKTRKEIMDRAEDFTDTVKERAEKFSDLVGSKTDKYRKRIMESIS
ncbi:MAG: YtxH domain-containing protein [Dehalogenimonas sp.]